MDSFRLVAAVVIACVAASLGLGATYGATRDRIAEQERLREEASLRAVLPDADEFERIDDSAIAEEADTITDGIFISAFEALDASGSTAGYAVRVAPRGYGGPMQMIVGLERDGEVSGVSIITMNETPGLGTKVGAEDFLAQFVGWSAESIDQDGKTMDAISGATKSSVAIRKGVLAAGHLFDEMLSGMEGSE